MAADIEQLAKQWEQLGQKDALWAILSEPERRGGGWTAREFFETGRHEIERTLLRLAEFATPAQGRALDFGCGVGRLTQALAEHFEQADGVDISSSMIEQARHFNRHSERCRYHHNPVSDLSLFEDARFDFVMSAITLQHVRPDYTKRYLHEFARVLKPGGLLYFQLPIGNSRDSRGLFYRLMPPHLLSTLFRWKHGYEIYEMHAIPREPVIAILHNAGLEVLDAGEDPSAGAGWIGQRYLARRRLT